MISMVYARITVTISLSALSVGLRFCKAVISSILYGDNNGKDQNGI